MMSAPSCGANVMSSKKLVRRDTCAEALAQRSKNSTPARARSLYIIGVCVCVCVTQFFGLAKRIVLNIVARDVLYMSNISFSFNTLV